MIEKTVEQIIEEYNNAGKTPKATEGSWQWFLQRARSLRGLATTTNLGSPSSVIKNEPNKTSKFPTTIQGQGSLIGNMILFQYDPKLKQTLPYYDLYPIGFPIEIYHDGYLMLNLHYLPPALRAKLMDSLYNFMAQKNKGITDKSKLLISYKLLKGASRSGLYKPCVKRYIFSNVRSQWAIIKPTEWDIVAMLPLQKFVKASSSTIWQDSVKKVQK